MIAEDLAKNLALAVPAVRRLNEARRRRRGYDRAKNDPQYPLSVFQQHRETIERFGEIAGRVLEIGPGGNIAVAALFVTHGAADAVCIDVTPWASPDERLYQDLGITSAAVARTQYVWPCSIEAPGLEPASFDIVFSHAAYEHFYDPDLATGNIARLLRPGAITTHQIDLRDHRDFRRPREFLRCSDRLWKAATSNRMLMTNRWRASEIRSAFLRHGLEIIEERVTERSALLPGEVARFAKPFCDAQVEDLETLGLFIAARKPG